MYRARRNATNIHPTKTKSAVDDRQTNSKRERDLQKCQLQTMLSNTYKLAITQVQSKTKFTLNIGMMTQQDKSMPVNVCAIVGLMWYM